MALIAAVGPAARSDPLLRDLQARLSDEWWIFPARPVAGGELGPLVLHPAHGIAVLVADRAAAAGAVAATRRALRATGIADYFDGEIPVVAATLDRSGPLPQQLLDAFTAAPPLTVADPDWVAWAVDAFADEDMPLDTARDDAAAADAADLGKKALRPDPPDAAGAPLRATGGVALPPAAIGEPPRSSSRVWRIAAAVLLLLVVLALASLLARVRS